MREQAANGLYACPCCGYATVSEVGTYEICPICFWEDDGQDDPHATNDRGGPNRVSLTVGRENYRNVGASDPKDLDHVRSPTPDDVRLREIN